MSWSDEELDKLFKDSADKLSFEFKPEFLDEFDAARSSIDQGAVSGSDEVDLLYQNSASQLSFEYKDAYWQEMQNFLPSKRQPDFLWWVTATILMVALLGGKFITPSIHQLFKEQKGSVAVLKRTGNNHPAIQDQTSLLSNSEMIPTDHVVNGTLPIKKIPNTENIIRKENVLSAFDPKLNLAKEIGASEARNIVSDEDLLNGSNKVEKNIQENEIRSKNDNEEVASLEPRSLDMTEPNRDFNELSIIDLGHNMQLPMGVSYFVEVNGGLSQSLVTPSDRISSNLGLGLGMQFQKGRYSLLTSLYGQISDHSDLLLTKEAKVYGFGSNVYRYTLKYTQLYSIEANISMGCRLGRHQIFAGVRPSYIVGTKVGVSLHEEEVQMDRQTEYGNFTGIKRFGLKPTIGYAYDLPRNFTIGLNLGIQTMQSVDEDFIDGTNRKMPIDGQLFLRKTINFRK